MLQRLHQSLVLTLVVHPRLLLVLLQLLQDGGDLLEEGEDDDDSSGGERPASADRGPDVEAVEVKDVNREHRSGPDTHEKYCEKNGGSVGCDLGSPELPDDNLQGRAVVEVLAVVEVELPLVLGDPWGEGVVDVPGLVPLLLLHLWGHPHSGDEGDNDTGSPTDGDGHYVARQHRQFLPCVLDENGNRKASRELRCIREPGGHS